MITEIYDKITEALRSIGEECGLIRHIDLWNQNVEFIDQDDPWDRPAVFVEFGPVYWEPYKGPGNGMKGRGEILLHIVTDWKGSAAAGSPAREETLDDDEPGLREDDGPPWGDLPEREPGAHPGQPQPPGDPGEHRGVQRDL